MLVYRVEHKCSKIGPYNHSSASLDEMKNSHCWMATHPSWFIDEIRYVTKDHLAGFSTKNQLVNWFGEFFQELHAAGFQISIYEVTSENIIYGKSKNQIAFKDGVFIRTYTIPEFLANEYMSLL